MTTTKVTLKVSDLSAGDRIRVKPYSTTFDKATNLRDSIPVSVVSAKRMPDRMFPGLPYRVVVEREDGGRVAARFAGFTTMLRAKS